MSIDLVRGKEYLSLTVYVWAEVLKFARLNGWKPMGTLPAEEFFAPENIGRMLGAVAA